MTNDVMAGFNANPLRMAGAAVWDKLAASVEHAERSMTEDERAEFWQGTLTGASRMLVARVGVSRSRKMMERALDQAAREAG